MNSTPKKRILFVCFGNASRSQMAEAFARMHGGEQVEAFSAGVRPSHAIDEQAVAAMAERGYDLRTHRPKGFADLPHQEFDVLVTGDRNLEYQQNPATLTMAVVVLIAINNRAETLRLLVPALLRALASVRAGQIIHVGGA